MPRKKAPKRQAWLDALNVMALDVMGAPRERRRPVQALVGSEVSHGRGGVDQEDSPQTAGQTFYMRHWARRILLPDPPVGAAGRRGSKSSRLEQVCRRYDQMLNAVTEHGFAVGDWVVYILALRKFDAAIEWLAWEQVMIWAETFQDQARLQYGVDAKDSATKLQSAGTIANLQVLEFVEKYWAETPSKAPFEDRLKLLGLFADKAISEWKRIADTNIRAAEQELRKEIQRGKEKPQT